MNNAKLKIAIWTRTDWAFGRVHNAVKKSSAHDVDVLDWRGNHDVEVLRQYDIINIPVIQAHHSFCKKYPELAYKTCYSVRGKAELYNYDPATSQRHKITREEVDTGVLPKSVVEYVNGTGMASCISHELIDLFVDQTKASIYAVPCGFDPDEFDQPIEPHHTFTVLCPWPKSFPYDSGHEYNVKRWDLLPEIEKRLVDAIILRPETKLNMDEMAGFYEQGDAILCLSHSEGNPLSLIEGGGCGLLPISTSVGIAPEIIQDGVSGVIIHAKADRDIIEECAVKINALARNRAKALSMRTIFKDYMMRNRTWDKVVPRWDDFYEAVFSRIDKVAHPRSVQRRSPKRRFHLLGLVHLPCSKKYIGCAFTQKNHKLARMLMSLGHEVIYYGAEGSNVPCTEFVQTHTLSDIRNEWGSGDNRFEIGYDYLSVGFRHDFNKERTHTTKKYDVACIEHINRIKKPDDFLLVTQGRYQKPVADAVGLFLTCEPGIGYRGSYAKFRAFESAFIQNFTYGSSHPFKSINGNHYDRVIPNYFDPRDVTFSEFKQEYFLYVGRVIKRKGVQIAAKIAAALNTKLIIAGQDGSVDDQGCLVNDFKLAPGTWEYIGFADVEKRKKLMAHARATIVATQYLEPFAGTHVESMLSGTPIITTNFGVFGGDTFTHGIHGFKCDTLDDFVRAGRKVRDLNPYIIRKHAEQFLMENVKWQYEKWFDDLYDVYMSAIVKGRPGWNLIREEAPAWRDHT